MTNKQKLIKLLAEAHSNETALISTLTAHLSLTQKGSYRSLLEDHLEETKDHAEMVQGRLDELGWSRNPLQLGFGLAQNAVKQGLVMVKGPLDALRGGPDADEKMLKNAMDEAMTEGLEIAAYDTIESVARSLGDHKTAELAASIRLDEEQMFESLRKEIPVLAQRFVGSEGNVGRQEPWSGYDEMTVDQIKDRLEDASSSLVFTVESYEKKNKNRSTVLDATERAGEIS